MTYTKKQVVTFCSVVFLLVATGLAGYASGRANTYSVPISDTLTGFATALPVIAGLVLKGGYDLTRHQERKQGLGRGEIQRPPLVVIANTIIFIYSSVVITLLGTHVAPSSELNCGLRGQWQTLFGKKDDNTIKKIQDAFNCCGLINSRDMAWPFPDKTHNQHACEDTFGRSSGCLAAWKAEEQHIAGILIGVIGMVVIWQSAIIVIPTHKESWLHRLAPDRISRMIADERHGDTEPRRAIDYIPGYNAYSDRVEQAGDEDEEVGQTRDIEEGNRRLNNALPGYIPQDEQPTVENVWKTPTPTT